MIRYSIILALVAAPALAEDPPAKTRPTAQTKTIDCYCTDRTGSRIELGETICMQVDGRMFMAQCQMSLNVPMWRETQPGCLSSGLGSPLGNGGRYPLQSRAVHAKI